jgi:hypothetical protein
MKMTKLFALALGLAAATPAVSAFAQDTFVAASARGDRTVVVYNDHDHDRDRSNDRDRMSRAFDLNRDGRVSRWEVRRAREELRLEQMRRARAAARAHDRHDYRAARNGW